MSFEYSVGDFALLIQLANQTYQNCCKAGDEYVEIATQVRCLYSVLKTVRAVAQRSESKFFDQNVVLKDQLIAAAKGCRDVLDNLNDVFAKYEGLGDQSQASTGRKLWQRLRFGSKNEELAVVRSKIIAYISTISVILDSVQMSSSGRIEPKVQDEFTDVHSQFEIIRREIYSIASQKRAEERLGAGHSTLSLFIYRGDDRIVWRDFRRALIKCGFRSDKLRKYQEVLQAYMLKLDESGILDIHEGDLKLQPIISNTFIKVPLRNDSSSALVRKQTEKKVSVSVSKNNEEETGSEHREDAKDELQKAQPKHLRRPKSNLSLAPRQKHAAPLGNQSNKIEKVVRFQSTPVKRHAFNHEIVEQGSVRSILKRPRKAFPEDANYVGEGVACRANAGKVCVPISKRYSRVSKKEASHLLLDLMGVRYYFQDDDIIILEPLEQYYLTLDMLKQSEEQVERIAERETILYPLWQELSTAAYRFHKCRFQLYASYKERYPSSYVLRDDKDAKARVRRDQFQAEIRKLLEEVDEIFDDENFWKPAHDLFLKLHEDHLARFCVVKPEWNEWLAEHDESPDPDYTDFYIDFIQYMKENDLQLSQDDEETWQIFKKEKIRLFVERLELAMKN